MSTVESPVLAGNKQEEQYAFLCSAVQRTCWYLDRMSPGNPSNNIAVRFMLRGKLHPELIEEALQVLIDRHETLRTQFAANSQGEPEQIVSAAIKFSMPVFDLRCLPSSERSPAAEKLAAEEALVGFDVTTSPLFRAKLVRLGETEAMLLITMHHIISDGWSVGVVTSELGLIYEALALGHAPDLNPLPIQYGDFACWQEEWLNSPELERQLVELKSRFDGFEPLRIRTDFERPVAGSSKGEIRSLVLPRSLTDRLKAFSDEQGCTLFVTMLSAFASLMSIESAQTDLVIRTQCSGREQVELEPLIGWFVNSILLRINLNHRPTFRQLVQTSRDVVLNALNYQHIPFERVMTAIQPALSVVGRQAPFQVNFIFQRDFVKPWQRCGLSLIPIPSKSAGTFVDLNFFLVEREDGWRASVDVNTDVFAPATGDFFLSNYRQLLESVAGNPDICLDQIDLPRRSVPENEQKQEIPSFLDNYVPPRNEVEKQIVEIWSRVLNVSAISVYSNFFDLGGHSLSAVRMLLELRQIFNREIKISELFVEPTPDAMARVILGVTLGPALSEIIPIQPTGSKPPFYMIGGDHWFRPLAMHVGLDRPFLGVSLLKYRHLDFAKERARIAEELAGLLMARQGTGPFLLGGWCADGLTAYEVAKAVQVKGGEIGLVALFDAVNPDYYRETRALVHSAGRTLATLKAIMKSASHSGLASSASHLTEALGSVAKRAGKRIKEVWTSDYSLEPPSFPLAVIRPLVSVLEEADLGWGRGSTCSVNVVQVAGNHDTMFKAPHVETLGQKLREQLEIASTAAAS